MSINIHVVKKPIERPSFSPYCQKLETFLRVTKLDYKILFAHGHSSPKGTIPYISFASNSDETLADTFFIIEHFTKANLVPDIDKHLAPLQLAESRAWISYVEVTIRALMYTRCIMPSGWAIFNEELFGDVVWPIKHLLGWLVWRQFRASIQPGGMCRHSPKEIKLLLGTFFKSLEIKLASQNENFLFGSSACVADIVVYSFLACILASKSNPYATAQILEKDTLRAYVARCTRYWFPEYKAVLEMNE
jgi:glutathione S-transferase